MNSTVLFFLLVAAVAAFTAEAMVIGIPMGGFWRNFGNFGRGGGPFGHNFMSQGDQNGIKFIPAAMVSPASTSTPSGSTPSMGSLSGLVPTMFGGMTPASFNFPL